VKGGLPWTEFSAGKAAKKSKLGDYATIHLGKWHLGDLWEKGLPGMSDDYWSESSPSHHGFDYWMTTQAEASNSMSNCGCFPVNHTTPGPKPPSGYNDITPHGDRCVVGGGAPSDWCYPCTNYYYPNASDARKVTDLQFKIPGDDSTFLVDNFEAFLTKQIVAGRPWLAHLCFHAIHEPHPAMPQYYHLYTKDPDYLGALTMWDVQLGRIMGLLKDNNVADHTAIFYTADNGPHQGLERSDIHYSTNFLRQCKASMWEGGIRVPGAFHYPALITANINVTTPATTADFLPTIMSILQVESDNPTWVMDGLDLAPIVAANEGARRAAAATGEAKTFVPRSKVMGFDSTGGQHALIDNNWKILHNPGKGQCDFQPPYSEWKNKTQLDKLMNGYFLFDLDTDYHELNDLSEKNPEQFTRMSTLLAEFLASVENSQANETHCGKYNPHPPSQAERNDSFSDRVCEWTVCQ
jgi:arylsulfatase A-like enzyme